MNNNKTVSELVSDNDKQSASAEQGSKGVLKLGLDMHALSTGDCRDAGRVWSDQSGGQDEPRWVWSLGREKAHARVGNLQLLRSRS